MAPSRQRSAPLPRGISAASPTLSICSQAASEAGEPSRSAAQEERFSRDPVPGFAGHREDVRRPAGISLPGESARPVDQRRDCHHAERRHHGSARRCASGPVPVLMSARPAPARGTRRMRTDAQREAFVGEKASPSVPSRHEVRARDQDQPQGLHADARQHKGRAGPALSQAKPGPPGRSPSPPAAAENPLSSCRYSAPSARVPRATQRASNQFFLLYRISQNAIQNAYFGNKKFHVLLNANVGGIVVKSRTPARPGPLPAHVRPVHRKRRTLNGGKHRT